MKRRELEWVFKLPPATLANLLSADLGELSDLQLAAREAIEALYSPGELAKFRLAVTLDENCSNEKQSVMKVMKV